MTERSEEFIESIYTEITDENLISNPNNRPTKKPELASCNIPSQPYKPRINGENALVCGTVFPDLSMPYEAGWHLYKKGEE